MSDIPAVTKTKIKLRALEMAIADYYIDDQLITEANLTEWEAAIPNIENEVADKTLFLTNNEDYFIVRPAYSRSGYDEWDFQNMVLESYRYYIQILNEIATSAIDDYKHHRD